MRIFITGATGFIGKHILNQLQKEEHTILASTLHTDEIEINDKNIQWLYGNLEDIESLKPKIISFNPEAVIHLAWLGIPDYSENISLINLNISIKLLDFILEETSCKKIIVSGSCYEYGNKKGTLIETDEISINLFFSWAKHSLYNYIYLKCSLKNVKLIWFRYFYVYGPGQRKGSLIPTIIDGLSNGKQLDIRNPYHKNDFIYVKDIAMATVQAVNAGTTIESGIYNLGSGHSTSVIEICRIVEMLMTGESIISNLLSKIEKRDSIDFWADISKTRNSLNWEPAYSIEDGLKEIIEKISNS